MCLSWTQTPSHCRSGVRPGHDSATGFPARSHHLSGLLEWTAVKGELLHHNQQKIIHLMVRPSMQIRPRNYLARRTVNPLIARVYTQHRATNALTFRGDI